MTRRATVTVVLAALAVFLSAETARGANVTATATVTGGTLTLSTAATPSVSASLDGTDQAPAYTLPMTVDDFTGTGSGWNVTVTSTTFTTGTKSLSTTASTVTGITAACVGGATCTSPTNAISYPLSVPAGATPPTAVKLTDAAGGTGLGAFTVTPTVQVSIPANTFAGTYTSTVTISAVSGP